MKRFFCMVASVALTAICSLSAPAALVTTSLDLVPAGEGVNRLDVVVSAGGSQLGSDTTDLSGNMLIELDLDLSGAVSEFQMLGGSYTGTDWAIAIPDAGSLTAQNTGGTFETPDGLSAVTGSEFTGSDHNVVADQGLVTLGSETVVQDLEVDPLRIPGTNTGKLILTPSGAPREFDVRLELPVSFSGPVPGATLGLSGNIIAEGSVTAVPEASGVLLLSLIGGGAGLFEARRRRLRR